MDSRVADEQHFRGPTLHGSLDRQLRPCPLTVTMSDSCMSLPTCSSSTVLALTCLV